MGMTIYYSGIIKEYQFIDKLREEIVDLAKGLNWKAKEISDEQFRGVVLIPPGCEPVLFTFNTDGKLSNIFLSESLEKNDPLLFSLFTKTQYADPEIHISIIRILKYISSKYFSEFSGADDGMFWETENKELLVENFQKNAVAIKEFNSCIEEMNRIEGESPEKLSERIVEAFLKRIYPGNQD